MVVQFSLFWGGFTTNVILPDAVIERFFQKRSRRLVDWISVDDSLPEFGCPVLVKLPGTPHALIAVRQLGGNWRFADRVREGVTHWRSLPELPQ